MANSIIQENDISNTKEDNLHVLRVLEVLSSEPILSQREISEKIGISVGLINLTIRRMINTGYIKMSNLSHKRVGYFLTPQGFQAQMKRSYRYLSKTIQTYRDFLSRTQKIIDDLKQKGHRRFVVLGEGEVADLVIQCLNQHADPALHWSQVSKLNDGMNGNEGIVLDARFVGDNTTPGVSILSELMNKKDFTNKSLPGIKPNALGK